MHFARSPNRQGPLRSPPRDAQHRQCHHLQASRHDRFDCCRMALSCCPRHTAIRLLEFHWPGPRRGLHRSTMACEFVRGGAGVETQRWPHHRLARNVVTTQITLPQDSIQQALLKVLNVPRPLRSCSLLPEADVLKLLRWNY